jgi:hypothetical protein
MFTYLEKHLLVCAMLCGLLLPLNVSADPFDAGSFSLSVVLGEGRAFNDTYRIFGVGAGYYVADGLELGLDYEVWSGGTPRIEQISPKLNYVIARHSSVSPYVGGFHRRTRIDGLEDRDAWGGRAGVYARAGRNLVLGFGMAYVRYQDCDKSIFVNCSDSYAELKAGFYY